MRLTATIRATPEDFVVDEIPSYEPSGAGAHVYVHFRKRDRDTMQAVRELAKKLGVRDRDAGTAGLKDRRAVTTQWASFPLSERAPLPTLDALRCDGIEPLAIARHGNKLKTGHLRGNRFSLVLRDVPDGREQELVDALATIGREGLANRFGAQRFGRHGDNAERAIAFLTGREAPPREPKIRRLLFSALQSKLFHAVLDARIAEGTWNHLLPGDLVGTTGGPKVFPCEDPAALADRLRAGEVTPTGPIFGAKMPRPSGRPGEIERAALADLPDAEALFERWSTLGEGARRPLILRPGALFAAQIQQNRVRVAFVLPKGSYATSVIDAVCEARESRGEEAPQRAAEEDSEP